jgi:hypothetical protein
MIDREQALRDYNHEEVEHRLRNAIPELRIELDAELVEPDDIISVLEEHGLFLLEAG